MKKAQPTPKPTTHGHHRKVLDLVLSLHSAESIDEVLIEIRDELLAICQVQRVTIFVIDPATNELFSRIKVKDNVDEIRVELSDSSIAGYTTKNGKPVLIPDVDDEKHLAKYPGLKFDRRWDEQSGFKTLSILCVPLVFAKDDKRRTVGAIQLINRTDGKLFSQTDLDLLREIVPHLAAALNTQQRLQHRPRLFEGLLTRNIITREDFDAAIRATQKHAEDPMGGDLATQLMRTCGVAKEQIGQELEFYFGVPFVGFTENTIIPSELLKGMSETFMRKNFIIPFAREEETIVILVDDPSDREKIGVLKMGLAAKTFDTRVSIREDILKFLDFAQGKIKPTKSIGHLVRGLKGEQDIPPDEEDDESAISEEAPLIIQTVNKIIEDAIKAGASDIHIEPNVGNRDITIRFRKDGACSHYADLPGSQKQALVNRLKIMAHLKVDMHFLPQSGKIKFKYGKELVELRVEVTPMAEKIEDVVMRVLASGEPLPIEKLNLSEANAQRILATIAKPYGILLTVGPTGSGKTTTLHSILGHINTPDKKILTAEDPVEITQKGLRQVQVNPNLKPQPYNFAMAMRSFLRADPDVIMVGEMRDRETAAIAIEASLTGHLVMSTLHTNSAPETVTRLIEMGMNPLNLSDALLGVLAQRLVRTLCAKCKARYKPARDERDELIRQYGAEYASDLCVDDRTEFNRASGCPVCGDTGYAGRTGVHEFLEGTKTLKALIQKQGTVDQILALAMSEGMRTLKMDGIQKVIKGDTDLSQVMKVCIE